MKKSTKLRNQGIFLMTYDAKNHMVQHGWIDKFFALFEVLVTQRLYEFAMYICRGESELFDYDDSGDLPIYNILTVTQDDDVTFKVELSPYFNNPKNLESKDPLWQRIKKELPRLNIKEQTEQQTRQQNMEQTDNKQNNKQNNKLGNKP